VTVSHNSLCPWLGVVESVNRAGMRVACLKEGVWVRKSETEVIMVGSSAVATRQRPVGFGSHLGYCGLSR
jgi:hypothetical protein